MPSRRMLVVPMLVSALSVFAMPAAPEALGGPRLQAAEKDCQFKWLADSTGTIYCKEEGTNCHAPCPAET